MSSLGGLKRKKHAASIFNEYEVSLTCLYFSNPKLLKNEIGNYVLLACPESWGGIKMDLVLFCFSMISLGNFVFFLLFCVLGVHVLQNLWSGCNLLLFLNQRNTGFYMHKYSQELWVIGKPWVSWGLLSHHKGGSVLSITLIPFEPWACLTGSNSLEWQKSHNLPLWLCCLVCRDAQDMQRRKDALALHHMSQQTALCLMSSFSMICTALSLQQGSCHAHPFVLQMIYIFIISLFVLLPSSLDWCQSLIATVTQD